MNLLMHALLVFGHEVYGICPSLHVLHGGNHHKTLMINNSDIAYSLHKMNSQLTIITNACVPKSTINVMIVHACILYIRRELNITLALYI